MSERADARAHEWHAYYLQFEYFSAAAVRDGCHPRVRLHAEPQGSVVLVHGLSDSPYFMQAIADHFYSRHRYNVYLPLLHGHGLVEPRGMNDVSLEEWKRNVAWSVQQAHAATPQRVSVGGLSTGGALSLHALCNNEQVSGDLFLFSGALDLIIRGNSLLGDLAEMILRNKWVNRALDARNRNRPLVGENPYRYAYVDMDGARELARLIAELDNLYTTFAESRAYRRRIFAAHSEDDLTADIRGIQRLAETAGDHCRLCIFPLEDNVTHAGLVLPQDLTTADGRLLEAGNRRFSRLLDAIDSFLAESSRAEGASAARD